MEERIENPGGRSGLILRERGNRAFVDSGRLKDVVVKGLVRRHHRGKKRHLQRCLGRRLLVGRTDFEKKTWARSWRKWRHFVFGQ